MADIGGEGRWVRSSGFLQLVYLCLHVGHPAELQLEFTTIGAGHFLGLQQSALDVRVTAERRAALARDSASFLFHTYRSLRRSARPMLPLCFLAFPAHASRPGVPARCPSLLARPTCLVPRATGAVPRLFGEFDQITGIQPQLLQQHRNPGDTFLRVIAAGGRAGRAQERVGCVRRPVLAGAGLALPPIGTIGHRALPSRATPP
jgi:hypothetical protein